MPALLALIAAFSMYSAIPMPQIPWEEKNLRYALCWFPLIGAVIGGLLLLLRVLADFFHLHTMLYAALSTALPIFVTGGIHLDGFCDVCDARASHKPREDMLRIMKEPQIGAFAAIWAGVYLLIQAGCFAELSQMRLLAIAALGFVQSRAWSALTAVTWRSAKQNGTLWQFRDSANRKRTILVSMLYYFFTAVGMLLLKPSVGICAIFCGLLAVLYYRRLSYRYFGGITGDLAGYFVQIYELAVLLGTVFGGILCI